MITTIQAVMDIRTFFHGPATQAPCRRHFQHAAIDRPLSTESDAIDRAYLPVTFSADMFERAANQLVVIELHVSSGAIAVAPNESKRCSRGVGPEDRRDR